MSVPEWRSWGRMEWIPVGEKESGHCSEENSEQWPKVQVRIAVLGTGKRTTWLRWLQR